MAPASCPSMISFLVWAAGTLAISTPFPSFLTSHIPLSWERTLGGGLVRRNGWEAVNTSEDAGFWFGTFVVGNASNLSMLIDTGSGDLIVNPGLYQPGENSQNLHADFFNSYGSTQSNGSGQATVTGELYSDTVTFGNFTAKTQIFGSATGTPLIPHDGIVGFSGPNFVQFTAANSTPFFLTLCNEQLVSECRFGLALNSDGTGTQILGELDTALYNGDLTVVPVSSEWVLNGDVAINNKTYSKNATVLVDSGTATIIGPTDVVAKIFDALGIQGVLGGNVLTGYFPCDQPPTFGFSLPSQGNASSAGDISIQASSQSTIFNIRSDSWAAANNGNNNCTSILNGQTLPPYPHLWIAGQAFFHGLYIDHNYVNGTMGFARLKPASSAKSTNAAATTRATATVSASASASSAAGTSGSSALSSIQRGGLVALVTTAGLINWM